MRATGTGRPPVQLEVTFGKDGLDLVSPEDFLQVPSDKLVLFVRCHCKRCRFSKERKGEKPRLLFFFLLTHLKCRKVESDWSGSFWLSVFTTQWHNDNIARHDSSALVIGGAFVQRRRSKACTALRESSSFGVWKSHGHKSFVCFLQRLYTAFSYQKHPSSISIHRSFLYANETSFYFIVLVYVCRISSSSMVQWHECTMQHCGVWLFITTLVIEWTV